MRLLHVTVDLASPVVMTDPLHLDAILSQAMARRMGHDVEPDRKTPADDLPALPLPLAWLDVLGARVWLATAGEPRGASAPAILHQVRRRDPEDWNRLQGPVNVAAGPTKDRLERVPAQSVAGVEWYGWGDRQGVMDLLRLLWGKAADPHGHLGSKRRAGAGEITAWSVEAADLPAERCLIRDGVAARHLPEAWVNSAARWRRGAFAGPYWHPDRQVRVPWVGAAVELRPEVHAALLDAR